MSLVDPILMSLWSEALKRFGPELMTPVAIAVFLAWRAIVWVLALRTKLAASEAEVKRLNEARATDAKTMLFEMYRVTRETEQARAARRDLDERFLPINEALLQRLAALGPHLEPITPESR